MCEQDPLDKILGADDDDDELTVRRPAPAVVKVGPQPRASRRRRRPVSRPDPEEEELLEEVPQLDETALPRRTRRGRSQRHAARELRREQEDLGVDEEAAIAIALAASLASPVGGASRDETRTDEFEPTVEPTPALTAGRTTCRQPAAAAGTQEPKPTTRSKASERRVVSRKRIVHVDPITGQRIRAPRFQRSITTALSAQPGGTSVVSEETSKQQNDETTKESDEDQPTAEAVAAETHRRAQEQLLSERLNRNLAAPVAVPSPLKPLAETRPTSTESPVSPDLMCPSPTWSATVNTSTASESLTSPSSQVDSHHESPTSPSVLDTSAAGGQDLMSRLQKRLRATKAPSTTRQLVTPLQEREQNCQDSLLADDM